MVTFKSKKTVLDSLAAYVEGEVLDGDNKYKDEASGEYVEAVKRTVIDKLPPVLILHLRQEQRHIRSPDVVGGQKFNATPRRIKQALGPKRHAVYNQHRPDHDQAETELHAKARP